MSLVKKLNNEIHDWNFGSSNIWVDNTKFYHLYIIKDNKTKNIEYFYYNSLINYKENINNLKLKMQEFYSKLNYKRIKGCYYGKKFIDMEEFEEYRNRCFYSSFCKLLKEGE